MCKLCRREKSTDMCGTCRGKLREYARIVGKAPKDWDPGEYQFVVAMERMFKRNERRSAWVPEIFVIARRVRAVAELEGRQGDLIPVKPMMTCPQCEKQFVRINRERYCVECINRSNAFRMQVSRYYSTGVMSTALEHSVIVYTMRHKAGKVVPKLFYRYLAKQLEDGKRVPEWYLREIGKDPQQ